VKSRNSRRSSRKKLRNAITKSRGRLYGHGRSEAEIRAASEEEVPPFLNFAPLDNAVDKLNHSAEEYKKALGAASSNGGALMAKASLKEINEMLIQSEHKLTTPEGLPRAFLVQARVVMRRVRTRAMRRKAIPAVREALEQKKWKQAEDAAARVGARARKQKPALISEAAAKLRAQTQTN